MKLMVASGPTVTGDALKQRKSMIIIINEKS